MSVRVGLYRFKKRVNSTKRPARAATAIFYDCEINKQCSVQNPILIFNFDSAPESGTYDDKNSSPSYYNYAYINEFKRYYWINEWVYTDGLWQAICTVDVLATYADDIKAAELYVLRATEGFNDYLIDEKYPIKAGPTYKVTNLLTQWAWNPNVSSNAGFYVVGVIGNTPSNAEGTYIRSNGCVTYYCMSVIGFAQFARTIFNDEQYLDINVADLSSGLQRALFNPIQYIVSVMFFPIPGDEWSNDNNFINNNATSTKVNLGWYGIDVPLGVRILTGQQWFARDFSIEIPKHPQAAENGKWMNLSPYTTYELEFPPFGVIPIDTNRVIDEDNLDVSIMIDLISGHGELRVYEEHSDALITVASGQVGIPIQLTQLSLEIGNSSSTTTTIKATVAGAAHTIADSKVGKKVLGTVGKLWEGVKGTWGLITGKYNNANEAYEEYRNYDTDSAGVTISEVTSDIGDTLQASLGVVSSVGNNGGFGVVSLGTRLNAMFMSIVDTDPEHYGRPWCKKAMLSGLQGFVKVADGDVQIWGTANEADAIRQFLEAGFFIEDD